MITKHYLTLSESKDQPGEFYTDHFEMCIDVMNPYQSKVYKTSHQLGFITEGTEHREVYQGPIVTNAHAFLMPMGTMISNSPQRKLTIVDCEIGDIIVINEKYVLEIVPGGRFEDTKLKVLPAIE